MDGAALARLQRQAESGGEEAGRAVAAFLRANPGWLAAHPELYAVLDPPRRLHGEALTDHMAAMLAQARRNGTDAAAGRRAADGFTQRVQDAVLSLMRAPDPAWSLHHDLPGLLRVDSVRLSAEGAELSVAPGIAPLAPGTVDAVLGQRAALVRDVEAGRERTLHGEAAPLAVREALIRVPLATGPGLLALATRDAAGLDGAGTAALVFLGQAAAAALEHR